MPVHYEVYPQRRIVRIVAKGDISLDEERAVLELLLADPNHESGFSILIDNRARGQPASTIHVRAMASAFEQHAREIGPSRVAIVVAREVGFGLGRMFALLTSELPVETNVFRDVGLAEQWIETGVLS